MVADEPAPLVLICVSRRSIPAVAVAVLICRSQLKQRSRQQGLRRKLDTNTTTGAQQAPSRARVRQLADDQKTVSPNSVRIADSLQPPPSWPQHACQLAPGQRSERSVGPQRGCKARPPACYYVLKKQTPGNANDFPEPWDVVPVEEFLGDEEGDDEDDIDRRTSTRRGRGVVESS